MPLDYQHVFKELLSHVDEDLQQGFGQYLAERQRMTNKLVLEVFAASRKEGRTGSLEKRIADRSEMARAGIKLAEALDSYSAAKGPGSQNAVSDTCRENGMMHCLILLERIVRTHYSGSSTDLAKLPVLLKRVRHLLRVYYDFRLGQRPHDDLAFCDWPTLPAVSFTLHQVGLCLQLDLPRLRAAMTVCGEELESFLLDEALDIGDFRKTALAIEKRVDKDTEADKSDRLDASGAQIMAETDMAAHAMGWFFADTAVAFLLNENSSQNADAKRWARKAMTRLVDWSTSPTMRAALADPLSDSLRPIYWSQPLLVRFSHAGGLAALYGDWTNSTCKEICTEALTSLPDSAWYNQTPVSLLSITRELQNKLNGSIQVATTPIFVDAFSNMFRRYGLAPFQKAAKHETHYTPVIFYYVAHRIKQDGLQMRTKKDWRQLLQDYINLPSSVQRRYKWGNSTIARRWELLELYGCCADDCPEEKALIELREKRVRGVRDADVEARLDAWGAKPKACSACARTAYCSSACQRAHWPKHNRNA
ncbi:MYND-type domain-containing protein [Favolaschia claudopus]|uniref:MYND-type domain-containing protein n=1 Tax=Favolaschia claudopus TaxID=2862362 RepID=A0AAW0C579_9AGAR